MNVPAGVQDFTNAHLHWGGAAENGPIIINLVPVGQNLVRSCLEDAWGARIALPTHPGAVRHCVRRGMWIALPVVCRTRAVLAGCGGSDRWLACDQPVPQPCPDLASLQSSGTLPTLDPAFSGTASYRQAMLSAMRPPWWGKSARPSPASASKHMVPPHKLGRF